MQLVKWYNLCPLALLMLVGAPLFMGSVTSSHLYNDDSAYGWPMHAYDGDIDPVIDEGPYPNDNPVDIPGPYLNNNEEPSQEFDLGNEHSIHMDYDDEPSSFINRPMEFSDSIRFRGKRQIRKTTTKKPNQLNHHHHGKKTATKKPHPTRKTTTKKPHPTKKTKPPPHNKHTKTTTTKHPKSTTKKGPKGVKLPKNPDVGPNACKNPIYKKFCYPSKPHTYPRN